MRTTRSAYAREDVGDQRTKDKAKPIDAKLLADLGRGLDKYFAQQERGTGGGHRQEVRRPFIRKKQEPLSCTSLRQAIITDVKATVRWLRQLNMIHDSGVTASTSSTEGWADCLDLDAPQRINGRHHDVNAT
jgi:hypothetical protein